ncbi:hypothetical protein FisN_14Lh136 [Fistulifera solaris]|uniref:Nuclear pore complex protein Nup85 n=1 Tax=Fistulifera solaris TaxID=1519565 RepID=A0A1Z5J9I7_FISSO|nr:hypothetical protein FisN_14Lh136 [Fistulifera solaris]|eukprot:GAX10629.1 hypothetical protein FisN_14Lh136 [Fistulifera solaris]
MTTTATTTIAWDPTRPSALQILQKGQVHTLQAGTGTGCYSHELTALIQLIPTTTKRTLPETLQHYRAVLSQCIDDAAEDTLDLDLLKLNLAVLHLSEIVLGGSISTAETVRYLRHHHLPSLPNLMPEYDNMLQAAQPEQWEGYWSLLLKFVMHGCLEEAWRLLSKHSLYVAATNTTVQDREYARTMREIEQSFLVVRDLLLLAPIPGGRTHFYDPDAEKIDEVEAVVVEDLEVYSHDYQFWETTNPTNHGVDVPLTFHAEAALRKHKRWQNYVQQVRSSLVRHIPELAPLLAILSGDIREAPCDSWQEALLVELLYRQPHLQHVSRRARALAQSFVNTKEVDQALLQVMEGNAGEALHLLYVYGAGTGAALPAVLLALLCNVFVDASILEGESVVERRIDFLCDAADAIRSSLARTEHGDLGVQLSVRLLLPFSEEERIRTWVADILEHYAPTTERYARAMVSLVRPLIERKSLQILDATATMLLSLYRPCMERLDFATAVWVLWEGVELESLVLKENRALGACSRALSLLCIDTVETILRLALAVSETEVTRLADAKVVGEAVVEALGPRIQDIPEAMWLMHSMDLVASLDQNDEKMNDSILQLLEGDSKNGVGLLRTWHWHVMRIAQQAIEADIAKLDTKCIRVLMERFIQLSEYAELHSSNSFMDPATIASIETALAHGLAKAFMFENAKKAKKQQDGDSDSRSNINTSNMHRYSLDVQQRLVEELLDS